MEQQQHPTNTASALQSLLEQQNERLTQCTDKYLSATDPAKIETLRNIVEMYRQHVQETKEKLDRHLMASMEKERLSATPARRGSTTTPDAAGRTESLFNTGAWAKHPHWTSQPMAASPASGSSSVPAQVGSPVVLPANGSVGLGASKDLSSAFSNHRQGLDDLPIRRAASPYPARRLSEASTASRLRRASITTMQEDEEKPGAHVLHHGGGQFVFSVGQYNLLAEYVGSNKNPWFLYGPDLSGEEGDAKRREMLKRFYGGDRDCRAPWPTYVTGILTEEEIKQVEEIDENIFKWHKRVSRLLENIQSMDVDILSLVELDHYEDQFKKSLSDCGYDSVFVKRPREASKDGCGVFWKRETFYFVAHSSLHFVDHVDSATNLTRTDRCCLCVLLKTRYRSYPVIFVSVHLARNPEDPELDNLRGKQLVQLLQLITSFSEKHDVRDAPVIVCGDINATSLSKLRGIAGAAAILAQQRIHPFLWRSNDVPSRPTSVTTVRAMRVDTILYQNTHLQLVDIGSLPVLSMNNPIPNEDHPSDHLPVKAVFKIKSELMRCIDVAREWWAITSGENDSFSDPPLNELELRRAFMIFDYDGTNNVDNFSLSRGVGLCQLFASHDAVNRILSNGKNDGKLDFPDFCVLYLQHERFSFDAMEQVFQTLDTNNNGIVTTDELRDFFKMFEGTSLLATEEHILTAMEIANSMAGKDADGLAAKPTGGISQLQFMRLLMVMYSHLYFSRPITLLFKEKMLDKFGNKTGATPIRSWTLKGIPKLARIPSLQTLSRRSSPRSLSRNGTLMSVMRPPTPKKRKASLLTNTIVEEPSEEDKASPSTALTRTNTEKFEDSQ